MTATNGAAAERLIRAHTPAAAVLDVMMPERTGLEVVRNLRPHFTSMPLILVSAASEVSDIQAGADVGASSYLAKPFSVQGLVQVVQGFLGLGDGAAAPA